MGPTCCRIGHAQSPDLRLYEATKPGCSFLFIMAALHSRCGHYIFILWFLLYYFFPSPNLKRSEIGCLPYFHTWCGLSANFRCRSETCCTGLAANTGRKKSSKIAVWAPSHNFVGLYLRGTYRQSEKAC